MCHPFTGKATVDIFRSTVAQKSALIPSVSANCRIEKYGRKIFLTAVAAGTFSFTVCVPVGNAGNVRVSISPMKLLIRKYVNGFHWEKQMQKNGIVLHECVHENPAH
jgi:hypothetical protein